MAPAKPTTFTAGLDHVERFDGGFVFDWLPPEGPPEHGNKVQYPETFRFKCRMRPFRGIYKKHQERNTKPPVHFHRYQSECFDVIGAGDFTVELNGVKHRITKDTPPAFITPRTHHVVYGTPGVEQEEVVLTCSSVDIREGDAVANRQLDRLFFENWYGYQEDVYRKDGKFDKIQLLSIFDAGDTYLSLPKWVPFREPIGIAIGIVVGRWIGGLLGYQPFYAEWSTDWEIACQTMEKKWSQRRFAKRDAQTKAKQRFLESGWFSSKMHKLSTGSSDSSSDGNKSKDQDRDPTQNIGPDNLI